MNEDRTNQPRSWLEKLTDLFSDDPQSRQDIKDIVREAAERSIVDADTLSILEGALQVSDMQVRDIMVSRSQMVSICITDPLHEFLPVIIKAAHSRIPVMDEEHNEVLGILIAKDLLPLLLTDSRDLNLQDFLRPATFVPESKRLNVLLHDFRENRNHMAIVVDEFGEIAGIVTIEDVLEQIVGDIQDEHDALAVTNIVKSTVNGMTVIKALMPVEDFNEYFHTEFSDDEFDTIGGIVMHNFGRMPEMNESIRIDGFEFKVVECTNRQLSLLEVTPLEVTANAE